MAAIEAEKLAEWAAQEADAEAAYEQLLREQQARRDRGESEPQPDGEVPF